MIFNYKSNRLSSHLIKAVKALKCRQASAGERKQVGPVSHRSGGVLLPPCARRAGEKLTDGGPCVRPLAAPAAGGGGAGQGAWERSRLQGLGPLGTESLQDQDVKCCLWPAVVQLGHGRPGKRASASSHHPDSARDCLGTLASTQWPSNPGIRTPSSLHLQIVSATVWTQSTGTERLALGHLIRTQYGSCG